MKRFKYIGAAFLLMIAVISCTIGAAKQKIVLGSFSNSEITVADGKKVRVGTELARMFNEEHPNIELVYEDIAAEGRAIHTVVATMLASRTSTYDVFISDVVWQPEFPLRKWYEPLDKIFPKSEQAKYIPGMINAWSMGGHIYGVPFTSDFQVMFYRKDLLEKAGFAPPDTWDELISICQKLQNAPGLYGFAADWQIHSDCTFSPMLWSAGGDFFDSKNITVNSPAGEKAMQLMMDMNLKYKIMQPGVTSMSHDETRNLFSEGRAIFHQNWLYAYSRSQSEEAKVQNKVGVIGIPRMSKDSPKITPLPTGGWSWSVNPFSPRKTAAFEVVKWLASYKVQKWSAMYWNQTPALLSLYDDAEVNKAHPEYALFAKLAPYTKSRFEKYDHFMEWLDRVRQEAGSAIIGKQTAKQAVNNLADTLSIWANLPEKYK